MVLLGFHGPAAFASSGNLEMQILKPYSISNVSEILKVGQESEFYMSFGILKFKYY